jgi:hypothetical protein
VVSRGEAVDCCGDAQDNRWDKNPKKTQTGIDIIRQNTDHRPHTGHNQSPQRDDPARCPNADVHGEGHRLSRQFTRLPHTAAMIVTSGCYPDPQSTSTHYYVRKITRWSDRDRLTRRRAYKQKGDVSRAARALKPPEYISESSIIL